MASLPSIAASGRTSSFAPPIGPAKARFIFISLSVSSGIARGFSIGNLACGLHSLRLSSPGQLPSQSWLLVLMFPCFGTFTGESHLICDAPCWAHTRLSSECSKTLNHCGPLSRIGQPGVGAAGPVRFIQMIVNQELLFGSVPHGMTFSLALAQRLHYPQS